MLALAGAASLPPMKKPSNPSTGARLLRVPLTLTEPTRTVPLYDRESPRQWAFSHVILAGSPYPKEIRLSITQFTFEQAVDVWMRHFSGQYQHQIAAAYVINVRAVNHVLKEKTHVGSKQVAEARF